MAANHNRTRFLALAALLAIVAAGLILALGGPGDGTAAAAKATKPPVVGKVGPISGNEKGLTLKLKGGGRERRLREGDKLRLGAVIDPDKGVAATLLLERPKGVSGDAKLIFIDPGKGQEHQITIDQTANRATTVTITD